ncbi:hypothetical protein ATO12_16410 [Aquimarina atlantica]|uniref:DUF1579 domain-containing protein n=1 Tax=Aquimarina atlantica TaxID=1317122 RepID=A0A023BU97_9FLAO|nr:hypothetical protein [Aquimarina atlantica]EZH73519.1 hypothetical protein ATO12_16410 [Aquimarina atlantica]
MKNNHDSEIPEVNFDIHNELIITPTSTSSKHDFDFFEGKFKLRNKKLKSILNHCEEWTEFESTQEMYKVLNGLGNIDNFLAIRDGQPFEGMTVRLFDPETRLWSMYWADSNRGKFDPPVVGSFENDIGYFFTKDTFEDKPIVVVFRWDVRDKNNPVWSQAFSDDNGETWEWNWYMYMTKIK